MTNQILSVSGQFANLLWRVVCWLFETIEQILTVILDCLARLIELILVIIKLIFQVICFVRDLCIDSMQTFANVFRGIVNVVNSIGYDDVEDFASACIVVALCAGGTKMFINLLKRGISLPYDVEDYGAKTRTLTQSCLTFLDKNIVQIIIWRKKVTTRIYVFFTRERLAEGQRDELIGDIDQHRERITNII